jgi:hypothetical protein
MKEEEREGEKGREEEERRMMEVDKLRPTSKAESLMGDGMAKETEQEVSLLDVDGKEREGEREEREGEREERKAEGEGNVEGGEGEGNAEEGGTKTEKGESAEGGVDAGGPILASSTSTDAAQVETLFLEIIMISFTLLLDISQGL